jgi:polar amino acid transport system substrate-binding protein
LASTSRLEAPEGSGHDETAVQSGHTTRQQRDARFICAPNTHACSRIAPAPTVQRWRLPDTEILMSLHRLLLVLPFLATALSAAALPATAQSLPARIQDSKVIRIAVNATYPPMESRDPATDKLVGFDVDLGNALAAKLGVKLEWSDGSFAQLIPSLQTGRADMILSGISDLPARRETLDFIDYLNSGAQFYTLEASPLKSLDELCGKRVGTVRSTNYPNNIAAWSAEHCEGAGKPAIESVGVDRMPLVHTELQQGRIDAAVQGSETLPALMEAEPHTYRLMGPPFTKNFQGIAFTKTDTQLRDAVLGALKALYADGTYAALIKTWKLDASAAPAPTLNGGPLP